ncbi:MAG: hypothetical protein M1820_010285 [Bogoriella megaspora]|nr:MAG: hypothetical protein M1820_010285 [Bogoriella megaspora]
MGHPPRQQAIIGICSTLIIISTAAVVVRLFSRRIAIGRHTSMKLWWDDWFAILALLFSYGPNIIMLVGMKYGLGSKHVTQLTLSEIESNLKLTYALQMIWVASMPCVKWSLLFFYVKLFPLKKLRIACWIVGVYLAVWFIVFEFLTAFQCSPANYAWLRLVERGHCYNITKLYIACSVLNILSNIVTLLLPMPIIWKLQINTHKKVALSIAFTIGGFVCIVSIIRLQLLATFDPLDLTWTQVSPGIWSCVECSIGVVVACIPSFTPIILSCIRGRMPATEVVNGKSQNHQTLQNPQKPQNNRHTFVGKGDIVDVGRLAGFRSSEETAVAARTSPDTIIQAEEGAMRRVQTQESYGSDELPLNGIFVTNEVRMTSEERTRRPPRTPTNPRAKITGLRQNQKGR